jgi:hypothetical protein
MISIMKKLRRSQEDRLELKRAYDRLFSGPDAEVVIRHLMHEAGLTRPSQTIDRDLMLVEKGHARMVWGILKQLGRTEAEIASIIHDEQQQLRNSYENASDCDT